MKTWKAIVSVVLVFVLGVLVGALGMHRFHMKRFQAMTERGPAGIRQALVRGLTWRLDLTPVQQFEADNAIRDAQRQFQEIRKEVQPRIEVILQRAEDRLRKQLDRKQQEKFDKIVAEHRSRWGNVQID